MGEKNEPKPVQPQNSAPQLPKVPENRIIHGNDTFVPRPKAAK